MEPVGAGTVLLPDRQRGRPRASLGLTAPLAAGSGAAPGWGLSSGTGRSRPLPASSQGPVSVPLPPRPFWAGPSPLFPSGTGRSPQRSPSGTGPSRRRPRVRRPVPLRFHSGPSPSSSLSLRIRGTLSPSSSPQDWLLSLRLPSPQGRSLQLRAPPPCPPQARGTPGTGAALRGLLTAVPATRARCLWSGIARGWSSGGEEGKDCSLLTPAQCGSARCRWDISTFQASAVGAAAGRKPQTQLSSELRDQCKRYAFFPFSVEPSAGPAW